MKINVYLLEDGECDWILYCSYNSQKFVFCEEGIVGFINRSFDFKKYDKYRLVDKYQCFGIYGDKTDLFKIDCEVGD